MFDDPLVIFSHDVNGVYILPINNLFIDFQFIERVSSLWMSIKERETYINKSITHLNETLCLSFFIIVILSMNYQSYFSFSLHALLFSLEMLEDDGL